MSRKSPSVRLTLAALATLACAALPAHAAAQAPPTTEPTGALPPPSVDTAPTAPATPDPTGVVPSSPGVDSTPADARLQALEKTTKPWKALKLSGYVQGRYEQNQASKDGLNGGSKAANKDQFLVRRGRLKAAYASKLAEYLLQVDATGSGVSLKDAEASFIEPWSGMGWRLTAGQFKWPFGYEVLQSSSGREMPERTRVIRALFPGERDRGARISGKIGPVQVAAAVVNGSGTTVEPPFGASDPNAFKDVVGRVGVDLGMVAGGLSGYWGKDTLANGDRHTKSRWGADLQLASALTPLGTTALKAEAILAEERGKDAMGWWALAVQDLGPQLAIFARVDQYDPDSDAGPSRGGASVLTAGGGLQYVPESHVKLSVVFEVPTTQGDDDPADNQWTAQIQGKF